MIKDRIRYRRKELHFSRQFVADRIGVSLSTIANYENGVSIPKIDELSKLMKVLDCDANYLYQDEMVNIKTLYLYDDEKEIIENYRKLDEHDKLNIKQIIKVMSRG